MLKKILDLLEDAEQAGPNYSMKHQYLFNRIDHAARCLTKEDVLSLLSGGAAEEEVQLIKFGLGSRSRRGLIDVISHKLDDSSISSIPTEDREVYGNIFLTLANEEAGRPPRRRRRRRRNRRRHSKEMSAEEEFYLREVKSQQSLVKSLLGLAELFGIK